MKLSLYYPIFPFHVNQEFGDNTPCVQNYFIKPNYALGDATTCPVGYQKLYPLLGLKGHDGVDLLAGEQNCYASCEGRVTDVSYDTHRGLGVYVLTAYEYDIGLDKPYRLDIVYWHFKEDLVKVGDRVDVGTILGITDSTGASTGNHLHFEVIPVTMTTQGSTPAFPTNGYRGAIDPKPFFNGKYAEPGKTPYFNFPSDLRYGMWNYDVFQMQKMLKYENFFAHIPTGYYGDITKNAVKMWQFRHSVAPLEALIRLQGTIFGEGSRAFANEFYKP